MAGSLARVELLANGVEWLLLGTSLCVLIAALIPCDQTHNEPSVRLSDSASEAEKKDLAEQQKEVMAEAKARGYDTKVMRKVIALRKREPDDIAEEEAVLEMYKEALGMS